MEKASKNSVRSGIRNVCSKSPSVFVTPIQPEITLVDSESEIENWSIFYFAAWSIKQANQAHHTTYAIGGTSAHVRPTHSQSWIWSDCWFLPLILLGSARVDCLAVTSPTTDIRYTTQVMKTLHIIYAWTSWWVGLTAGMVNMHSAAIPPPELFGP